MKSEKKKKKKEIQEKNAHNLVIPLYSPVKIIG